MYSLYDNVKYRPVERKAFCRCCDNEIQKGEMMISMYSWRGSGQHIYFCKDCVQKIHEMTLAGGDNV